MRRYLRFRGHAGPLRPQLSPTWTTRSSGAPTRRACTARDDLRALHRGVPGGHGFPRRAAARRRAQGHRAHPADGRAHRAPDRQGAGLRGGRRRLLRGAASSRPTASCRARTSTISWRARGSTWTSASATRATSRCGSRPSRASPRGRAPGGRAGPAGTSSARRWPCQHLGETLDIHGGGEDLIFPHHEYEIAQSEARDRRARSRATGCTTGCVNLGAEKMSKSLGNTLTIRDAGRSATIPRPCGSISSARTTGTRSSFSDERIERGGARARRGSRALVAEAERLAARGTPPPGPDQRALRRGAPRQRARFEAAMDDDFNTPQALGVLFDLARALQTARARGDAKAGRERAPSSWAWASWSTLARALGLLEAPGPERRGRGRSQAQGARSTPWSGCARRRASSGDFAEADRLRDGARRRWAWSSRTRARARPGSCAGDRARGRRRSFGRNPVLELLRGPTAAAWRRWPSSSEGRGPALQELLTLAREPAGEGVLPDARAAHRHGGDPPSPGGGGAGGRGVLRRRWRLLGVPGERGEPAFFLALDRIQDPRNLGAVLRTAEATGVARGRSCPSTTRRASPPAVAKVGDGGAGARPGGAGDQPGPSARIMKKESIWVMGAAQQGGGTPGSVDLTVPVCLVLGGEGEGLRPLVARTCDLLLTCRCGARSGR